MKLNKLFTVLMAAAVVLGCAGCKNNLTLAEKLVGKNKSGPTHSDDLIYYPFFGDDYGYYVEFDETCTKIKNLWCDLGQDNNYIIPPAEYKDALDTMVGSKHSKYLNSTNSSDAEDIVIVENILNNSNTKKYKVEFANAMVWVNFSALSITNDKHELLSKCKKNVDLVLPAEIVNHDILYLYYEYDYTIFAYDYTLNKTYKLIIEDDDTAEITKGPETPIVSKPRSYFPDISTTVVMPNETGYNISKYIDGENTSYTVGRNDDDYINNGAMDSSPLIKTADNRYIIYGMLGG